MHIPYKFWNEICDYAYPLSKKFHIPLGLLLDDIVSIHERIGNGNFFDYEGICIQLAFHHNFYFDKQHMWIWLFKEHEWKIERRPSYQKIFCFPSIFFNFDDVYRFCVCFFTPNPTTRSTLLFPCMRPIWLHARSLPLLSGVQHAPQAHRAQILKFQLVAKKQGEKS